MDDFNFNKTLSSSTPIKPGSGGNKSDNENELNPEPRKKQLVKKTPKRKILGVRNETLEQSSLQRSNSFGSKPKPVRSRVVYPDDDMEKDGGGKPCLPPYDPVENYLSPRPKFLRYNPNRRRKILNLQENDEDRVKISTYFAAGNDVQPAFEPQGSCSHRESVEEARNVSSEEDDDDDESDEENEMVEFGENRCCSLKGLFKFVFVVFLLVLTTNAICSMNSPSRSQALDSVSGFNHSVNRVYDLKFEVGYGLVREPVCLVERLKEEFVEFQNAETNEAENGDSIRQDEILQDDEIKESEVLEIGYVEAETVDDFDQDGVTEEDDSAANDLKLSEVWYGLVREPVCLLERLKEEFVELQYAETNEAENGDSNAIKKIKQGEVLQEDEIKESEVLEIGYVEVETVDDFDQDGVTEEDDSAANEKNDQLTSEAAFETVKTNDVLINFTSFDLTVVILIGHMLILTSIGAIYRSRCKRVKSKEFKDLELSVNSQSMKEEEQFVTNVTNEASSLVPPQQNDVTKEFSHVAHVHIPSVELLGEFVFGEDMSTNMSPENQKTAVSSSQREASHAVKKQQRPKNSEVVTPSQVSVRRSSRLKTRSNVVSS